MTDTEIFEQATHIEVDAGVRYWEDAIVNDVQDDEGTLIPGRDGDAWKVYIRLADGKIDNWPEGTTANIHYKVCDDGLYWLTDTLGKHVAKWKGSYVPNYFLCHGGEGYGDYIIMDVGADGVIAKYDRPFLDIEDWEPVA